MKIAIVLSEELGSGLLANAAACIASGLFYKEEEAFGSQIEGADCTFLPITKIPILMLKQHNKSWVELLKRAKRNKLKCVVLTKEAQSTTSYDEYRTSVEGKRLAELSVIGIGVLGEDEPISKFGGDLPLLR